MIKLYQAPRLLSLPNLSPAAMKLETWLRMAGIAYEICLPTPGKAPKGKVPYIERDGVLMGDSTLIVERLTRELGKDLDAHLGPSERAVALAFRRMLKENVYWVMAQARYVGEENWAAYKLWLGEIMMPGVPADEREKPMAALREYVLGQMHGQGMGRHTAEEVYAIGAADIGAVADFLGDKPYFMGDKLSLADATVYAYVANIIWIPLESSVRTYGLGRENLVSYCERMQGQFFPELGLP